MDKEEAIRVMEYWSQHSIDYLEADKKNAECGTYLVQNVMMIKQIEEAKEYIKENLK